jgi:hypothetical protein
VLPKDAKDLGSGQSLCHFTPTLHESEASAHSC